MPGCLANLAYFIMFAGMLFAALMGGHGLTEQQWRTNIIVIVVGGFAIWFGGLFCYWWFIERRRADNEIV